MESITSMKCQMEPGPNHRRWMIFWRLRVVTIRALKRPRLHLCGTRTSTVLQSLRFLCQGRVSTGRQRAGVRWLPRGIDHRERPLRCPPRSTALMPIRTQPRLRCSFWCPGAKPKPRRCFPRSRGTGTRRGPTILSPIGNHGRPRRT